MAQVIEKVGRYKGWSASEGSHFDAVARSIVFQQLSGKAAGTIHGRFQGLYGGRTPLPVGRCAVVADPWGNLLVVLDLSKGRFSTDADGNVTGVQPQ